MFPKESVRLNHKMHLISLHAFAFAHENIVSLF